MAELWLPEKDRTRVTQNGSTLSFMDHELFAAIGALAHKVGELTRHNEPFKVKNQELAKRVGILLKDMDVVDQFQVGFAVDSYINLATTHPEGSRICTHDPHHELAALTEGELYQASGLAADLLRVCP